MADVYKVKLMSRAVCLYGEFTMMEIYTVSFFGHRQLDELAEKSAAASARVGELSATIKSAENAVLD